MVVRILDHVKRASTYEEGEVIYRLLLSALKENQDVVLSFDGIKSVPSAFINASLVRLLEDFSFEQVKEHLTIKDSTKQINALIRQRFSFSAERSDP